MQTAIIILIIIVVVLLIGMGIVLAALAQSLEKYIEEVVAVMKGGGMMNNIAETTGNVFQEPVTTLDRIEPEDEQLYFELKDNYHTFQIGLKTMLECLAFAIERGELPNIQMSWWNDVSDMYGIRNYPKENEEHLGATAYEEIQGLAGDP